MHVVRWSPTQPGRGEKSKKKKGEGRKEQIRKKKGEEKRIDKERKEEKEGRSEGAKGVHCADSSVRFDSDIEPCLQ